MNEETKNQIMHALKPGGDIEMVLYHPGRQTERSLIFSLDPDDSVDSDVQRQILQQVESYEVTRVLVNKKTVWTRVRRGGCTITFDYDKVNMSY